MDDCVGYAYAYALLPGFSRVTFTVLDGAGHNLQVEYLEHFCLSFTDFLNRAASM